MYEHERLPSVVSTRQYRAPEVLLSVQLNTFFRPLLLLLSLPPQAVRPMAAMAIARTSGL